MIIFFNGNTIVNPGDPVLIYGDGLEAVSSARIARLDDEKKFIPQFVAFNTPVSVPTQWELDNSAMSITADDGIEVDLIQKSERSVKLFIPETLAKGAFAVTLYEENGNSQTVYLNTPSVKWVQGDEGSVSTVGGWARLTGEKLSLDGKAPRAWLVEDNKYTELSDVKYIDAYSAEVKLPDDIIAGEYKITLSNGFGGRTACSVPLDICIVAKQEDTRPIINITDFGADPMGEKDSTEAFANAFEEARRLGGAVVKLPRGRFWLTGALNIPNNTKLVGASRSSTQMFWTPFDWAYGQIPEALIYGDSDITIEEIDFRGTRVRALFAIGINIANAKNIKLKHIRAYFNAFAGHEYHITEPANRNQIVHEILGLPGFELVRIAGDNVQITDSEFANTGMTFGNTNMRPKRNFLFRNNMVKERISGWAYFVHSDNSIIEDNDFEGCTVGFGGANAYLARNYIHDVLNNDREAFTTDMSYSTQSMQAVKIEGTKITFKPEVKLVQDRVTGFGGLYITDGKGTGQARKVVSFTDNEVILDSPFAVEPDTEATLTFGGTFRSAFYLINNTTYNTGHLQFFVDQCSSVYDGNIMRCSAGMSINSWQMPHNPKLAGGTLPLLTRTQTFFISMINNTLEDGNLFHLFGKRNDDRENGWDGKVGLKYRDGWSGFATIGCCINGIIPTNIGMLIQDNVLNDNSFITINKRGVAGHEDSTEPNFEDAIIDNNTVSNSNYGLHMNGDRTSRMLISRNDFSENVDNPMVIDWELNKDDIELVGNRV